MQGVSSLGVCYTKISRDSAGPSVAELKGNCPFLLVPLPIYLSCLVVFPFWVFFVSFSVYFSCTDCFFLMKFTVKKKVLFVKDGLRRSKRRLVF